MFRNQLILILAGIATSASAGPCPADLAPPFGTLNIFDVSAYLNAYNDNNPAADLAEPVGVLNFFDISAYLQSYAAGCAADSDGDRIPDAAETNNGQFLGLNATGTDPFDPDTDGDGLADGDEVYGSMDGVDLPAMGASPLRKDIFIECDWFAGVFEGRTENYRPTATSVNRLVAAFATAPVDNPYGLPDGISIHLDYGQGGAFTGGNQLPGAPAVIQFDSEFNGYKAAHFDPRRKGLFHYAIFANRYNTSTNGSSGVAEINGDDFMVTMVNYFSSYNQSQTIMHELGHNLGLRHGGFENRNHKPNYNSVMNYRHQFPGVDTNGNTVGDGVLDYSSGFNFDLNENALNEALGVIGLPVDLDRNGAIAPGLIARNINCGASATQPCGSGTGCEDSVCTVLEDFDDWSGINWDRLNLSLDRGPREISLCENQPDAP
jgi:hypothetical protein